MLGQLVSYAFTALFCWFTLFTATVLADDFGCSESARLLRYACEFDTREGLFESRAVCLDSSAPDDECFAAAEDDLAENREECADVLEARLEVCEALDDAVHEPEFGEDYAGNFVDPLLIGNGVAVNPYFPLVQGNRWTYEGTSIDEDDGEEVTETIVVTVTNKTKLIDGITCLVVNDTNKEDGEVIEDTDDWFAQDLEGNVWYCGEISREYELFDGDEPEIPELVDIEGSWKAGREGSKAGMLIPFAPEPGDVIRQEVAYGEAEDVVEIVSLSASESAPGGSCTDNCLHTIDFTPLEPDTKENKYYAPGIGLIVEVDPDTGERVELLEFVGVGS
ncbi:MAG: hypothetical protein O7G86_19785 [Gammaproteobacteria bacterium]|nr:hypothetical protein [Gammaproteobacteria bacterium]